jgi:hypothetical protein
MKCCWCDEETLNEGISLNGENFCFDCGNYYGNAMYNYVRACLLGYPTLQQAKKIEEAMTVLKDYVQWLSETTKLDPSQAGMAKMAKTEIIIA